MSTKTMPTLNVKTPLPMYSLCQTLLEDSFACSGRKAYILINILPRDWGENYCWSQHNTCPGNFQIKQQPSPKMVSL